MASDPNRQYQTDSTPPNSASQSKSNNPFIKFRQFADEQIGSLLQGIIGLPSAFSSNHGGATGRWAEFDEDLRRRDKLQARQKQMTEADGAHIQQGNQRLEHEEATRKSYPPMTEEDAVRIQRGMIEPQEMDEKLARDLPLYSPVKKTLFTHLRQLGDDDPEFKPSNLLGSLSKGLAPEYWPFFLRREQESLDMMRTMQYMIYNDLNSNATFSSDYSLLPYILFSPYSPLKLSADRNHLSFALKRTEKSAKPDSFPYCAAFEDLIRHTHGQSFNSISGTYHLSYLDLKTPFMLGKRPSMGAFEGIEWIAGLYESNILQQKEIKTSHQRISWPSPRSRPRLVPFQFDDRDADTEQDMYDYFLRWASSPTGVTDAVEAILGDSDNFIQKQLKSLHTPEGQRALREMLDSQFVRDILGMVEEVEKANRPPNSVSKPVPAKEESKPVPTARSTQDPNKVVASNTTSEHIVDEDGSAETTVTVWKRFADGRESTTTTTHYEEPSNDEMKPNSEARAPKEEKERGEKKSEEKSKNGWFWNQ